MSIFCKLGFHNFKETYYGVNWRMSTDKSIEWQKRHFGWKEFRMCSRCGKMQFREISTSYSRIVSVSIWLEMNKSANETLQMYKNFK
jgi:hypothetical protein